jgi:hypothetical protein
VRELAFVARMAVLRSGERRATVVAATAWLRDLWVGDVVRVPAPTGHLAPGYYLVTRVFPGGTATPYHTEVWLAWVAGEAVLEDVVAERRPHGLRVESEQVCWFWDDVPSAGAVGTDGELEAPVDVAPPEWLLPDGAAGAPVRAAIDGRFVPVALGPMVSAGRGVPRACVIQALEAGADPLPVTEWALARRRGAGLGAAEDLGPEVHGQVEIEVFLPRRSWVRRRVAETPQDVVRRMAEPGATPDAVFTLVGDVRRSTP